MSTGAMGGGGGGPAAPDAALRQAMALQMSGRVDDAERALRAIVDADSTRGDALLALAALLAGRRRMAEAEDAALRARRARPRDPRAALVHANILVELGRREEALAAARSAVELAPGNIEPLRIVGALAIEVGRFEEAAQAFGAVCALKPRLAEPRCNLGAALLACGKVEDAEREYRAAVEIRADCAPALLGLGDTALERGDADEALRQYRAVLALPDRAFHFAAHSKLGHAQERRHELDAAAQSARAALALKPDDVTASRLLARVDRAQGRLEEAAQRLSAAAERSAGEAAAHAYIELGQTLDRLNRCDEAFACFERAQALFTPPGSAAWDHLRQSMALLERLSRFPASREDAAWCAVLARADESAAADGGAIAPLVGPPVFLLGFPRSGTTLVEQTLAAHGAFVTSDERTMLVRVIERAAAMAPAGVGYPECLLHLSAEQLGELRRLYAAESVRMVGDAVSRLRLVDKHPYSTPHLALIRLLFPRSPLLVALRDPRDPCLSLFMQDLQPGRGMHYPNLMIAARMYAGIMGAYLHGRETLGLRAHEFRYEDVVRDLEGQCRSIIEFLGEDWRDAALNYADAAKHMRSSSINLQDVTQPVYTRAVERWKRYARHIEPIEPVLRPFLQRFGYE